MAYAVIRIRGRVRVRHDIAETMNMLHLNRVNHCVVLPETDSMKGMLQKVKDYVTWGEIDKDTLVKLLKNRGFLYGDKPLSEEYLKAQGCSSFEDMADKVISGEVKLYKLSDFKPVFRLAPPKGGFKNKTKRAYKASGELGYRGNDINDLINRMIYYMVR